MAYENKWVHKLYVCAKAPNRIIAVSIAKMQLIRIWRKSAAIAITPVAVKGFQFPIAYFRRENSALKQRLIRARLNRCIILIQIRLCVFNIWI